jgi:hypothetical protein
MSYDHEMIINAGAIPVFIDILNIHSSNPQAVLHPLTILAGLTRDSNKISMYDDNDIELEKAVFKVIAENSENKEILSKCVIIIQNIVNNTIQDDSEKAILFCNAVSFIYK